MGVLGPKYYNLNGIWDLKPHYLGPWTLRVTCEGKDFQGLSGIEDLLQTGSMFSALSEIHVFARKPSFFTGT